jgi:arylsulfatase A-like enzyme
VEGAADTTPALARLAAEGTSFPRAFAASSWTLPSMAMLLTGAPRSSNDGSIRPGDVALAEVLRDAGYAGAAVIANALLVPAEGYARGFDRYDVRPPDAPEWVAEDVVERGLARLAERDPARPFFLFLHLFDPHYPYAPPAELVAPPRLDDARRAAFAAALPQEERALLDDAAYEGLERLIARYDGEVRRVDRALGRFLTRLDELGLRDDTLVVVTSDHGEGLWQRAPAEGEARKTDVHFPALYYSHGVQLYGEQVHVPLVLRGPGVPAGATRADAVSLVDLPATVLALLGVPAPPTVGGRPLLHGAEPDRPVYAVCSRLTSVTVGDRWRLHVPREHRVERFGAAPELYDLAADPLELAPVDDPGRTAELAALVARWRERHAGPAPDAIDADERARLEALGYAGEAER